MANLETTMPFDLRTAAPLDSRTVRQFYSQLSEIDLPHDGLECWITSTQKKYRYSAATSQWTEVRYTPSITESNLYQHTITATLQSTDFYIEVVVCMINDSETAVSSDFGIKCPCVGHITRCSGSIKYLGSCYITAPNVQGAPPHKAILEHPQNGYKVEASFGEFTNISDSVRKLGPVTIINQEGGGVPEGLVEQVATNTANIATNTANIATNTANISSLQSSKADASEVTASLATTLASAKSYADAQDAVNLASAKSYTDAQLSAYEQEKSMTLDFGTNAQVITCCNTFSKKITLNKVIATNIASLKIVRGSDYVVIDLQNPNCEIASDTIFKAVIERTNENTAAMAALHFKY